MTFLTNFCLVLTKMASELCPAGLTEVLENLGGVAGVGVGWDGGSVRHRERATEEESLVLLLGPQGLG